MVPKNWSKHKGDLILLIMDPKILLNYINMRLDSTPLTLNAIF